MYSRLLNRVIGTLCNIVRWYYNNNILTNSIRLKISLVPRRETSCGIIQQQLCCWTHVFHPRIVERFPQKFFIFPRTPSTRSTVISLFPIKMWAVIVARQNRQWLPSIFRNRQIFIKRQRMLHFIWYPIYGFLHRPGTLAFWSL